MRILYVGNLRQGSTASHRCASFERLGCEVVRFDVAPYYDAGLWPSRWIRYRTLVGPAVTRFNRDFREFARDGTFSLVWMDKVLFAWPETIRFVANCGLPVVAYNVDNPFGPRGDPGWRHVVRAIPEYHAHIVSQPTRVQPYREAGARHVVIMPLAYEPSVHFAPPGKLSDTDRDHDVLFIGHPHDARREFILTLWRKYGIVAHVRGPKWNRILHGEARRALYGGGPLRNEGYREAIWRSRICLGFVTHSNLDLTARRTFEITACGGFLLTKRTEAQQACFSDGQEVVMYDDVDECAAAIRRYLPDEAGRCRIAEAGYRRAVMSGYGNDAVLTAVLNELTELEHLAAPMPQPAQALAAVYGQS